MFLHEDRELFEEVIVGTGEQFGLTREVVEKDYYVTMILKQLAERSDVCVFKGGTSLSKCFHAIDRFSEDIDITFTEYLGESRRKRLKYKILKPISDELRMEIKNWNQIESDKDYNCYLFSYVPVGKYTIDVIKPEVKLETALASYAFPTELRLLGSYVYDFLKIENNDIAEEYHLQPFEMRVQSLNRTFIDKIFALCDYYMQGKSKRYSRHLYDLFKRRNRICFDDEMKELVREVREHRKGMSICPSAQESVDIVALVNEFCDNNFYKSDYESITEYFVTESVAYDRAIANIREIVDLLF